MTRCKWVGEPLLEALRRHEFERDDYVDDRINGTTIPFQDEDLYDYKSIEIPEIELSTEQCELMVEYIVEKSQTLGPEFNAMKHLAYLAYNALLDVAPSDRVAQINSESDPLMVPFFHKYRHYTEVWFQTKGRSKLFADFLAAPNHQQQQQIGTDEQVTRNKKSRQTIELIRKGASLYERKATIGAWAFSYLAAIKMESEGATREYTRPTKLLGQMMRVYLVEPAYTFVVPHLNRNHLNFLDEELLFIVLRGAIIFENILDEPKMFAQRELLLCLAYYALRGHCLALMNWFNDVADTLRVPVEPLFEDMNELLLEVGQVVLARNVRVLKRFHREYVLNELPQCDKNGNCRLAASRYYLYARLFLHEYFHCFGHIHNETTIAILAKIKGLRAGLKIHSYSEVGNSEMPVIDVIASLIYKKYCTIG